jgi:hypothetical protein
MTASQPSSEIAALLRVPVTLPGGSHEAQLRIPTAGDVLPVVADLERPGTREEYRQLQKLEVMALVESVDGRDPSLREYEDIVDTPEALRAVIEARNQAYTSLLRLGRFSFVCPSCATEAPFDLATYAIFGLRLSEVPTIVTPVLSVVPRLSGANQPAGRPEGMPPSGPISFRLPTAAAGLDSPYAGGILGDVTGPAGAARVAAAWERWAPPGFKQPFGRSHWRRGDLGFEAVINLSAALERLDGAFEINPEIIEGLSVPDFYFLDLVYHLTHDVEIAADSGLVAPCTRCGCVYMRAR